MLMEVSPLRGNESGLCFLGRARTSMADLGQKPRWSEVFTERLGSLYRTTWIFRLSSASSLLSWTKYTPSGTSRP